MKSKGEKERYSHLNAEFQSIARRDKKAFLSDQCKEIEEKNKWERLEISSRKLDTKGACHAKTGTIKDRNRKERTDRDYTVEVRSRLKGLDLIDREPGELWMEVRDIVQETGIKTIPIKKRNAKRQNGCLRRPYK